MSIQDAAAAAVATFPDTSVTTPYGTYSLPVVMVAIFGAETGGTYNDAAAGDPLSIYPDGGVSEQAYSCGGMTSFGLPQINLPANSDKVASLSGIAASDPCGQAAWLSGPVNAAQAALAVYQSQGLGAWTTWNEGTYSGWLSAAQQAVSVIVPVVSPPPPPSQPPTFPPLPFFPSPWPWVGLGAVGLLGLIVALHSR